MSRPSKLAAIAVAAVLAAACAPEHNSGHLAIESPWPNERLVTQPLVIVRGEAFEGREILVRWRNETAGTSGPAQVDVYEMCWFLGCWTVVEFSAAVSLVPGANHVRIAARDLDGNWAVEEIDLSFVPGAGGAAVHITAAPSASPASVAGTGSGLVALEWRNDLTGASAAIQGESYSCSDPHWSLTNLTHWSACIPLAAGVNRITVRGDGWDGAIVQDVVDVIWTP